MKEKECGSVSLVMEHFNLSQQPLLDSYLAGELTPGGLLSVYQEGEEGHGINYSSDEREMPNLRLTKKLHRSERDCTVSDGV